MRLLADDDHHGVYSLHYWLLTTGPVLPTSHHALVLPPFLHKVKSCPPSRLWPLVSSPICPRHNGHAPTRCKRRCFPAVCPKAVRPSRLYSMASFSGLRSRRRAHKHRLFHPIQNSFIRPHTYVDAALSIRNFEDDHSVSNHAVTDFPDPRKRADNRTNRSADPPFYQYRRGQNR